MLNGLKYIFYISFRYQSNIWREFWIPDKFTRFSLG